MSALSEVDIKIHENGEASSEDDAFDKKIPSPVAPCPYIDFVPLNLETKPSQGKRKLAAEPPKEAGSGEEGVESLSKDDTTGDSEEVLADESNETEIVETERAEGILAD